MKDYNDFINNEFDEDDALDDDDKELLLNAKVESESKLNDFALNVIKEARRNNNSFVDAEYAKTNDGRVGAQSGIGNDNISNSRQLDPRISSIIDKMGIYKNLSTTEIENWKNAIVKEPISVLEEVRKYYTDTIEPILKNRESILQQQIEKHGKDNVSIFMYVSNTGRDEEDGTFKENQKLMAIDLTKKPGFEIYNGQIIQQMRPDQTPFPAPSVLFKDENNKEAPKMKM